MPPQRPAPTSRTAPGRDTAAAPAQQAARRSVCTKSPAQAGAAQGHPTGQGYPLRQVGHPCSSRSKSPALRAQQAARKRAHEVTRPTSVCRVHDQPGHGTARPHPQGVTQDVERPPHSRWPVSLEPWVTGWYAREGKPGWPSASVYRPYSECVPLRHALCPGYGPLNMSYPSARLSLIPDVPFGLASCNHQ